MNLQRWQAIQDLFEQAIDVPPAQREAWLAEHAGGDETLLHEVRCLLANDNDGSSMAGLVGATAVDLVQGEQLPAGTRLGPYAIAETIDGGGMGTVYRAERADGLFEQTVAIKVVHGGRLDAERMRRFEEERRILARLEHPNIARILDGGSTEDGAPYLVMEYVDGQSIDAYVEAQQPSQAQRLLLFRDVCSAVHAAHQKLVVHSDIKPSNVMVSSAGDVRLLDFGIASLVGGSEESESAGRAMTPGYASPEQQRGDPIGTASDIYALGLLLHTLLTGALPQPPAGTATETTPVPDTSLDADLRSIISKALMTDPAQRYESAARLAEDIENFLGGFPVSSRSASWTYRARRFYGRHRYATSLGLLLVVAVLGLSVFSWVQSGIASRERDQALAERSRAEGLSQFLIDTMASAAPENAQGREVTVRQMLDQASEELGLGDHALQAQAVSEATLRRVIGSVYAGLGLIDSAEASLQQALALHRNNAVDDPEELYLTLHRLANVEAMKFNHEQALVYLTEALAISEAINGPDHRDTLGIMNNIAGYYLDSGDLQRAEQMYVTIYQRRLAVLGPDHEDTLNSLSSLGIVNHWQGELDEARGYYEAALEGSQRILGERHPRTLSFLGLVGNVLEQQQQYQAALPVLEQHIALCIEVLGGRHPGCLRSMHILADVLRGLGRFEEAEARFLETLALRQEALGDEHVETLQTEYKLARLYGDMGRHQEAQALAEHALASLARQLGEDHPTTGIARGIRDELQERTTPELTP